jgi:hypothetical protein
VSSPAAGGRAVRRAECGIAPLLTAANWFVVRFDGHSCNQYLQLPESCSRKSAPDTIICSGTQSSASAQANLLPTIHSCSEGTAPHVSE